MPAPTKAALIALLFAAALAVRIEVLWRAEAAQTLPRYVGATQTVVGTVASDPDARDTGVRVNLAVQRIASSSVSGTLLTVLPKGTAVAYGDLLAVRGAVEAPQSFVTDTGRTFDYPGYLRVQGVSAVMQHAAVVSRAPSGFSPLGALYALKHSFERSLERILPAQDAALLEGILLGARHGLPDALTQAFIAVSLVHVVVLSGYNISIVAEATLRGLRFLPRGFSYAMGALLMVLFVLMTGAGSTSLRAGIMALIAIFARYLNRSAVAMRSLVAAAMLLVLINPLVALYDESFILSILATFGLITLGRWVEARLPRPLKRHEQLRSIAASTIAVQIYVLPALLYYSGVLSFVALPANMLTLPLIPFAMLMGFIAGVLGLIHPLLGLLPALLSDLVLRWMMFVAQTFAALLFSHAIIPPFGEWLLLVVYIPLTIWAIRVYRKSATIVPRRSAKKESIDDRIQFSS